MIVRRQQRALTVAALVAIGLLTPAARPCSAEESAGFWQRLRDRGGAFANDMRARAKLLQQEPQGRAPSDSHSTHEPRSEDLANWQPGAGDVQPPRFSRIVIEANGAALFQGVGTPGSEITLSSAGKALSLVRVDNRGRWTSKVGAGLSPGEYRVTTSARLAAGNEATAGQDVRIRVPDGFSDRLVVLYNGAADEPDPARVAAERLAEAASRKFSEVIEQKRTGLPNAKIEVPPPASPEVTHPNVLRRLEEGTLSARERVQDWLAKANRTYQQEIARRLSKPAEKSESEAASAEVPATTQLKPYNRERDRLEAQAKAKEAEQAMQAEKEARRAELNKAEQEADAKARVQAAAREAEARAADVRRLANLVRQQREARRADEVKRQEEAKRLALEAEIAKKKTLADAETKKREVAKRLADEAARKAAEQKRLAEEQALQRRQAKSAELAEKEAAALRREEEVLAQQDEAERLAADLERRIERPLPVPPPRAVTIEEEEPGVAPVANTKRERDKDPRPSEGSAEEPAPGDVAAEAQALPSKPRVCRLGRNKRGRRYLSYVVRPGDTLWSISERYLGDGARFDVIFRANEDRLFDPNLLRDCQRIIVPLKKRRRRH